MSVMSRRGGSADFPLHGRRVRRLSVATRVLDHTIGVLKQAMQQARLGNDERLQAIARPDAQARRLQATAHGPSVDDYIAQERRDAHRDGGRSVFGWEAAPAPAASAPPAHARAARR